MPKLFHSLTDAHKAALKAALAAASLPVTNVEGGFGRVASESTHTAANQMRLRVTWSVPPTNDQLASASAIVTAYAWN